MSQREAISPSDRYLEEWRTTHEHEWVTVAQAAIILQASQNTIYNWIRKDLLPVYITPTGKYRLCRFELVRPRRHRAKG